MFNIREELRKLPEKPGVYFMKNTKDEIIYIGKAKNLKNRVRSYFSGNLPSERIEFMTKNIKEFEYIVTDSEVEALILESNLIKKHQPRYNILLKDDKSYPFIKITIDEKFPKVYMVYKHNKDKSKYLGPFTSKFAVNETIELIHQIWPIRVCNRKFPRDFYKQRACLNYHIGKCAGPCIKKISEEDYDKMISEIIEFLSGKHEDVIKKLEEKMVAFSEELEFEKAAEIRDKIMAIRRLYQKQKTETETDEEQDIIAFSRVDNEALFQVFFIRMGKMLGREHFMLSGVEGFSREEVMTNFIKQFYTDTSYIPKEIVLENNIEDFDVIRKWLSTLRGKSVMLTVPQKGDKLKLVQMAHKNAIIMFEQFGEKIKKEEQKTTGALEEIRTALGTQEKLDRIEAYDISNTQGFESVASMVVFEKGKPKSRDYRKFKIKNVFGADDYASMEEVITRRLTRYKKEQEENEIKTGLKFSTLPDIIFIDGGKGQISSAMNAMKKVGIEIPVCGMVKDDKHRTRGLIFNGEEINFKPNSEAFKLITRIQDEVHRFAIEYHRKLREKILVKSALDDIEFIGEKRRKELVKYFGSIDKIKVATIDELELVPLIDKRAAKSIYDFFRKDI